MLRYKNQTKVRLFPGPQIKMDKHKKLQELTLKRDGYKHKLTEMYKHFRGVKHENALSELKYSQIKVYEDMLNSVVEEINKLENK